MHFSRFTKYLAENPSRVAQLI